MLKKIIFILILLQFLSFLEACCKGGLFHSQAVRFKLGAGKWGNSAVLTPNDSVFHQNLVLRAHFIDSVAQIGSIQLGLMPALYACEPVEIGVNPIQKVAITNLTALGNHLPAGSDITPLFTIDSIAVGNFIKRFNDMNQSRIVEMRFQPPFVVHQTCQFRMIVTLENGFKMEQDIVDLKLF